MNASRLKEIVELLLDREEEYKIQTLLNEVNSNLSNLASAPQEQSHQTGFANALEILKATTHDMSLTFEPAELELFAEIGADEFFSPDIGSNIERSIQENPITPTVSQKYVSEFLGERQKYITEITQLYANLEYIGVEVIELDEGTAEIGFLIPRKSFNSDLGQLIDKLADIRGIIRVFSETATGSVPTIEVRQISNSDPLFFFGLDPRTICMIGGAITWALHSWKQVQEIKEVRARVTNIPVFVADELKFFDDKIRKTIEAEIKKKVGELLKSANSKTGRTKAEQKSYIKWAVETVLALVERGMKVEIRYLPPTPQEGAEEDQEATVPPELTKLDEIIPKLVFPPVEGATILDLPPLLEFSELEPETKPKTRPRKPPPKKTT